MASRLHQTIHKPVGSRSPHDATIEDIVGFLKSAGIGPGSSILLHSSWARTANENVSISTLLNGLTTLIGDTGTLAMPAFPKDQDPNREFLVKSTPSGAGLLTEAFRRAPNVKRSININHSVCALGPASDYLTESHHKSVTSWDQSSPYFRIGQVADSWIVGMGVGHRLYTTTSLHCVESILRKELPYYSTVFPDSVTYKFRDQEGNNGSQTFLRRVGAIYPAKLARHFSSTELIETCVGGLDVYAIRADLLISRTIELGRQGKTMYCWPIPWPWKFRSRMSGHG